MHCKSQRNLQRFLWRQNGNGCMTIIKNVLNIYDQYQIQIQIQIQMLQKSKAFRLLTWRRKLLQSTSQ